jgi:hypothetical protein
MQIYNHTGIFAEEATEEATEEAQDNVHEPTVTERAKNAVKRANAVMASDKPAPEQSKLNAHDEYRALQLLNPIEAGIYWRANREAILACKFTD